MTLVGSALGARADLFAQDSPTLHPASATRPVAEPAPLPDIEELNLVGADISMPRFSDTVLGIDSPFRRFMYSRGFLLRDNANVTYTQNTLSWPVPASLTAYVGDRPFLMTMSNPILTYDLRALHLHNAQLYIDAGLLWASWNPAGPIAASMTGLYFYKEFAERRVEFKFGYIHNDLEFLGMQVGGSLSTGALGVYAVLPFEVGLSRLPLTAPSFNLKLNMSKRFYLRTAVQRSLDARGGTTTINRNATGFRFIPKGEKLLNVFEVGYKRLATDDSHELWVRAGYMHNSTLYPNIRTGIPTSGNYCAYILADRQLAQTDAARPSRGVYAGVSAMTVPSELNVYTRYYEARLYDEGPFRSRPGDTFSIVASHSDYSPYTIAELAGEGKTFWRNSDSLTGSYNFRISRGQYINMGLSYIKGPAVTPRVANALTFTAVYNVFF